MLVLLVFAFVFRTSSRRGPGRKCLWITSAPASLAASSVLNRPRWRVVWRSPKSRHPGAGLGRTDRRERRRKSAAERLEEVRSPAMRSVDNTKLERWRELSSERVLMAIADHAKPDATFEPTGDVSTKRWHANVCGSDFELLLTGPRFFDTRAARGGGGAVDLVMHLTSKSFRAATQLLDELNL